MAPTPRRLRDTPAPSVRLTPAGAALVALAVALPGGAVAGIVAWLVR